MSVREDVRRMKEVSPRMAAMPEETRNAALFRIAEKLKEKKEEIFAANAEDLARAQEQGVSAAVKKRLKFDEGKLSSCGEDEGCFPKNSSHTRSRISKNRITPRMAAPYFSQKVRSFGSGVSLPGTSAPPEIFAGTAAGTFSAIWLSFLTRTPP